VDGGFEAARDGLDVAHRRQLTLPQRKDYPFMTSAREIMTPGAECANEGDTLLQAAQRMAELNVGALPICSSEKRLIGVITDRDIVIHGLAAGKDPSKATVTEFAQGEAVTIGADDDAEEILRTMSRHQVRRLPVIDGHQLVGVVALADVAKALPDAKVGDLLGALSKD
jgi:CBS domain-containing protein